jgi:hypothetical protein
VVDDEESIRNIARTPSNDSATRSYSLSTAQRQLPSTLNIKKKFQLF